MTRIVFIVALLIIPGYLSVAQENRGVVRGRVYDARNNEPIPFASIGVVGTTTGTTSDLDGNFLITGLQPGTIELGVSFVGYATFVSDPIMISNTREATIEVPLEEIGIEVEEVVVRASVLRQLPESPLSARLIGIDEIERSPGGNRDISRVIQSFPGVASNAAFRNDVIVRGGGPNENRFYVDGIEIPYLNHFSTQGASGGPVGIINVDFIRSVEFLSGSFPASRGNALSSIMSFSLIDGNSERMRYRAAVGASDIGITAEGPLSENSTFIFSARRSYLQFLFDVVGLPFLPTYNGFQFKYRNRINQQNELTVIGIGALDQFALNLNADDTEYQRYLLDFLPVQEQYSYTVGAVWKRFRDNGFENYIVSRSYLNNTQFKYAGNVTADSLLLLDYLSGEGDNRFRYERIIMGDKGLRISFGAGYENALYRNSTFRRTPVGELDYSSDLRFSKFSLFTQATRGFVDDRLKLSLGVRSDFNNYSSDMNNPLQQLSPRISATWKLASRWSLLFSSGRYYQLPPYTALGYRDSDGVLVNRENRLRYISSDHITGGVSFAPTPRSQITVEGFYKGYSDYPYSVEEGVPLSGKSADYGVFGDEELSPDAEGRSYGIEVLGRLREFNGINMVAAYTLVRSEFRSPGNDYIPTAWDNRHLVSLTATKRFNRYWDLGVRWRFVGGTPYTPFNESLSSLKEVWDVTGAGVPDFSRYNSMRLRPFHELDIRVDRAFFFDNFTLMLYADIQNVYNHQADQPAILIRDSDEFGQPLTDPDDMSRYRLKYISGALGTILPTVGIIFEF